LLHSTYLIYSASCGNIITHITQLPTTIFIMIASLQFNQVSEWAE